MAKVVGACHSVDVRGSVGPLVFSRGRSGGVVRAWARPVQARGPLATYVRRMCGGRGASLVPGVAGALGGTVLDKWLAYADSLEGGARGGLSWEQLLCRQSMGMLRFHGGFYMYPGVGGTSTYLIDCSVVWTAEGALLSFSPAITGACRVLVAQRRNLSMGAVRPVEGVISHIFDWRTVSPVLVTPPAGDGSGPGDLPPILSMSVLHVYVASCDGYARVSVWRFFRLVIP
jgi:hypothetical protein